MKKHLIIMATLAFAVMLTAFSGCKKVKPQDNTPAQEGLYLGIVGFNSELYTMPLGLLNQSTKTTFENFVDNLTMQNGTILYHAVNTGLTSLAKAKIPENLINVSVVTFTDGLDKGSYEFSNYSSGAEYLSAVHDSIINETIGGNHISAYSIGIRGSDVGNNTDAFYENLRNLSSDPTNNVYEVNNMNEASEKFAEIAQKLYQQSSFYNVSLKLSAPEPNYILRFTFDNNINSAEESQCYIQGTYIRQNDDIRRLTNIEYVGLQCQTGPIANATWDGRFIEFSFKNLTDNNGNPISTEFVKLWEQKPSSTEWDHDSEFTPSGNTGIVNEYKSAMIMLVLDCSSSLGSDFINMKTAANGFIETLSGNYGGRK